MGGVENILTQLKLIRLVRKSLNFKEGNHGESYIGCWMFLVC